jgi:hypothetical protein
MKKELIRKYVVKAIVCFALFGLLSCTETPSSPPQGGSVVAMRTQLDNSIVRSSAASSRPAGISVDSLQVTQAVFAANNFMLRSDISDDVSDPNLAEGFIHQGSFILAFDESGKQYIGENIIFSASYRRARFDLQPIHTSPDSATQLFGQYASLFASGGMISPNTVIIKGFVWKDGMQMPFTYSAAMTGGPSVLFETPLAVSAGGSPMEVLVGFSSSVAFTDKTGSLMDPRDLKNALDIDANIRTSLRASLKSNGSQ